MEETDVSHKVIPVEFREFPYDKPFGLLEYAAWLACLIFSLGFWHLIVRLLK